MSEYLFSYGTLQHDEVQISLFGRKLAGSTDKLRGYQVAMIRIDDPIFLSRGEQTVQRTVIATGNPEDCIEGMALELSEEELLIADQYEPKNYQRINVILDSGKESWIYQARDPFFTVSA